MNQKKDPKAQQINIELGEKEAEGIYSNLAIITHSPAEFIIDFTRVVPGSPKAKLENEKPKGETVDYDDLIKAWKAGKVR